MLATARNGWRQLTSMRTALILLFLLALAAIPGSILPQRSVNIGNVNSYYADNPDLAPVLDRLGFFDVYSSPWFSAIYLLLFISLLGCILPRLRDHGRSLRRAPVAAPARFDRLPQHAVDRPAAGDPAAAAEALRRGLRARRWRTVVREQPDGSRTVSAEKGYLKETGNLLMHVAMVAVLIGVAVGGLYGWHGNRLVVAGPDTAFCNVLQQYDEYGLGSRTDAGSLPQFCFELADFDAEFTEQGQPLSFLASGVVTEAGEQREVDFTVNRPLRLDGASVYLLGNGFAPILRYTDRFGQTQTVTVPFEPIDGAGTAEGTAMFPDANVDPDGPRDPSLQVAFEGLYLPTAPEDGILQTRSAHPEERAPLLLLFPYQGDLGIDDGSSGSVLRLDPERVEAGLVERVGTPEFLRVGEELTLPDETTVEFLGTQRVIFISVRSDPGEPVVLAGAALLIGGLIPSLLGRRRRVWFRVRPDDASNATTTGSIVEAGGLPRSDHPGFAYEFRQLVDELAPAAPETAADADPATATTTATASRST